MASILETGASRWPAQLAISDGTIYLSFRELHAAARCLAGRLMEAGVRPGDRVGVAGERNADAVVAILAIGMAGAAYVPVDITAPAARLAFLLQDANVCGVVGTSAVRGLATGLRSVGFFVDLAGVSHAPKREIRSRPVRPLPALDPSSVAYIMYTSGSTGVPKGVQIEHRSVQAFFDAHNERIGLSSRDRCLSTGALHFDVSLLDIFLPLHVGATVFLSQALPIPSLVLRSIEQLRVTHFYAVGTLLSLITGDGRTLDRYDLSALRMLQTGAEVCNVRVVNEWLRRYPGLHFLNSYGPTEATVGCISYHKRSPGQLVESECPIGRPHSGTRVQLLHNEHSTTTEPGALGELLVAGPQLMRGYWRRSLDNKKAFLQVDGERYYRTGDLAWKDRDGNYHFVGRVDDEIKLNGYRIHPNEICRCLLDSRRVEAVVAGTIQTGSEGRELVVAVTSADHSAEDDYARELIGCLESTLPAYMRPTRLALMRDFPRLSCGKTDRDGILMQITRAVRKADSYIYSQRGASLAPLDVPCR